MDKQEVTINRIKALEITQAYAEYKMRSTGDLDGDLMNWTYNLMRSIRKEKARTENTHQANNG